MMALLKGKKTAFCRINLCDVNVDAKKENNDVKGLLPRNYYD